MDHLEEAFGDPPSPLVVMLQEVHHESLSAILKHPWIRENFALSRCLAPEAAVDCWRHLQSGRCNSQVRFFADDINLWIKARDKNDVKKT
jgi:hypothetical protein